MRAALLLLLALPPLGALDAQRRPCIRGDCPIIEPLRPVPALARVVRGPTVVRAEMAGRVVRYEVSETFVNRGGAIGEADYMFPLPRNAAFQNLELEIDGELVAGETLDAAEARRIYEEIVRSQRDPALVEWMGHGLLRTRIFPIQPGQERRVVVRFHVVPEREGGSLRIDWFRGSSPRVGVVPAPRGRVEGTWSGDVGAAARSSFTLEYPASGYGRPYSPTHELRVVDGDRGRRRVEVRGDAKDVTVLLPLRRTDHPAVSVLSHAPGSEPGFALVTLSPPTERARRASLPRDVTLVLDVSGSMSGRKMEQARAAGRQLLATLGARDRFRIVDFSTDVRTFRDEFVLATRANVRAAERYLEALEAQGSTNIEGALREGLRTGRLEDDEGSALARVPIVLFVTDGEPTVGARTPDALARVAAELRGRARLFTFGVGSEVNVPLVERLALEGRGTAHFVRPDESVERVLAVVASRITSPVVTDLVVRTEGGARLQRVLPAGPVDLFAGQDLVLLARYSGSGGTRLRFEGRMGGEPVTWTAQADFPERDRANPFVARLWATQRVGWLSAEKRRGGCGGRGECASSAEIDQEIRELGERFGIPTEFTSYFVREPGMVAGNIGAPARPEQRRMGQGAARLGDVMTTREADFAAAKAAAGQRGATTLAAAEQSAARLDATGAPLHRVAGRAFALRDSVWTDAAHRDGTRVIEVKAFSAAYFALLDLVPSLREPLALGERVLVAGRGLSVEVGVDGVETLSAADRVAIQGAW